MEKIKVNFRVNEKTEKLKGEALDSVLRDSYIHDFVNKHNLTTDFLYNYLAKLMDVVENHKICKQCSGINNCQQELFGKYLVLNYYENEIILQYTSCEKYKNYQFMKDSYLQFDFEEEWLGNSLKDVKVNDFRVSLLSALVKKVQNKDHKGIYLHGESGIGKSFIMAAFANTLILTKEKCCFIDFRSYLDELRNLVTSNNNKFKERINVVKNVPYLFIDDIGNEKITDFSVNDVLYDILDYRFKNRLPVFFTSIYSVNELIKRYKDKGIDVGRLRSKIINMCEEKELQGFNCNI